MLTGKDKCTDGFQSNAGIIAEPRNVSAESHWHHSPVLGGPVGSTRATSAGYFATVG